MSWDWEQERDNVAVRLRADIGFPIGPLELADQMRVDASTAMVIEHFSRVVYGRGTGTMLGILGAAETPLRCQFRVAPAFTVRGESRGVCDTELPADGRCPNQFRHARRRV